MIVSIRKIYHLQIRKDSVTEDRLTSRSNEKKRVQKSGFPHSENVRTARGEIDVPMSRNGECRFSIPRVYFVLQSRYGDKEDRRVECIFVEWRVFIGSDMLFPFLFLLLSLLLHPLRPPPPLSLSLSEYRVDYVAPNTTINFENRKDPPRGKKIDLFHENPKNISALQL